MDDEMIFIMFFVCLWCIDSLNRFKYLSLIKNEKLTWEKINKTASSFFKLTLNKIKINISFWNKALNSIIHINYNIVY